jgi:hypothetical protein
MPSFFAVHTLIAMPCRHLFFQKIEEIVICSGLKLMAAISYTNVMHLLAQAKN